MSLPPSHCRPRSTHWLVAALALLVLGLANGCANYQLGTGADSLPFRTLYVAPVENTAALPQAVATFSRELRNAFATDGRIQLASSPTTADAILEVDLADFDRSFTAVRPNDTALARKFDLRVTARCTLRDAHSERVYFAGQNLSVTRQIFVDDGQNPAEYQVQPQLASALADRVVHRVLDLW